MILKKNTLKKNPKNPSNRIGEERWEGGGGVGRCGGEGSAEVLQTYLQTYRASDEAGSRGAFTPKNQFVKIFGNT